MIALLFYIIGIPVSYIVFKRYFKKLYGGWPMMLALIGILTSVGSWALVFLLCIMTFIEWVFESFDRDKPEGNGSN